jgi:(heptosyl)LPS beta-1,4-glucosyltransferase
LKKISVVSIVYNEEKRIEDVLKCLDWCEDIVIIDKSSTDSTVEIALKYNAKIVSVPYSDSGDEIKYGVEKAENEWILFMNASDVIAPTLVKEVMQLINKVDFNYDIISVPFSLFVLGINSSRSPWCVDHKEWLFKKSVVILEDKIHHEIEFNSKRIYKMTGSNDNCIYHLTHADLNTFLERSTRYTKAEAKNYSDDKKSIKACFKDIIKSIYYVVFRKKSFLLGWDGIALGLAYICYFILKYLNVWEKFRGNGSTVYSLIKEKNLNEWDKNKGIFTKS